MSCPNPKCRCDPCKCGPNCQCNSGTETSAKRPWFWLLLLAFGLASVYYWKSGAQSAMVTNRIYSHVNCNQCDELICSSSSIKEYQAHNFCCCIQK